MKNVATNRDAVRNASGQDSTDQSTAPPADPDTTLLASGDTISPTENGASVDAIGDTLSNNQPAAGGDLISGC